MCLKKTHIALLREIYCHQIFKFIIIICVLLVRYVRTVTPPRALISITCSAMTRSAQTNALTVRPAIRAEEARDTTVELEPFQMEMQVCGTNTPTLSLIRFSFSCGIRTLFRIS